MKRQVELMRVRHSNQVRFLILSVLATQIMEEGRYVLGKTDEMLNRQRRIVQDTIQVATTTAETLHTQTEQLNRVDDDLEQIQYSLKGKREIQTVVVAKPRL